MCAKDHYDRRKHKETETLNVVSPKPFVSDLLVHNIQAAPNNKGGKGDDNERENVVKQELR